jgi:hypothetical protein
MRALYSGEPTFVWLARPATRTSCTRRCRSTRNSIRSRLGKLSTDGDTIEAFWRLSRDDSTWDNDLAITFRRR